MSNVIINTKDKHCSVKHFCLFCNMCVCKTFPVYGSQLKKKKNLKATVLDDLKVFSLINYKILFWAFIISHQQSSI